MSDKTSKIIEGLKDLAKIALGSDSVEAKFTDNKLEDGTIIRYEEEEIAQGVIVSVVDESGNVLPLPIGMYKLEDGTTFEVVDDAGIVDNVVVAEVTEEESTDKEANMEEKAPVTAETEQAVKSVVETVTKETRFEDETKVDATLEVETKVENVAEVKDPAMVDESFASVKAEFKAEVDALTVKVDAQDKLIKDIFAIVEGFGTEEEVKTPETKTNVFKKEKRMTVTKEQVKAAKQSFRDQLSGKA